MIGSAGSQTFDNAQKSGSLTSGVKRESPEAQVLTELMYVDITRGTT